MKQPHQTIRCVKRLIGRSSTEIANKNEDDLIIFRYENDEKDNATVRASFRYKERKPLPEFVSAFILYKISSSLIDRYKLKNRPKVVISVPAYFTQKPRFAASNAGKIAGLDILRVFNEPTAGAFAYELGHVQDDLRNILIQDFGDGTFDVTNPQSPGKGIEGENNKRQCISGW